MSVQEAVDRLRPTFTRLPTKVRNRLGRVRWYRWRMRSYVSSERPIVIGGSPRSGTTLFRRLLDSHSRIVCGPESNIFLPGAPQIELLSWGYDVRPAAITGLIRTSGSQARYIEEFFRAHCERVGKPRWSEKTPLNVAHLDWIWEHFPEARFIHVIRDGRDVVCSMRRHPDRKVVDGHMVEMPPQDLPVSAFVRQWVRNTGQGIRHRGDPRYMEIRYEELVERPRETLERIVTWVGEPFEEGILAEREGGGPVRRGEEWDARSAIEASSVGRWRTDLSDGDREIFKRLGTSRLVELGYAEGPDW